LSAGGKAIEPPFDIPIGRCASVRDPFGNDLVILDQSKGVLATDAEGRVPGVRPSGSVSASPGMIEISTCAFTNVLQMF
jgi:hypothetical protein